MAIQALKNSDIRQESVDLICATTYTYRDHYDDGREKTATNEMRHGGNLFVEGRQLAAGEVFTRDVRLHIARSAAGTAVGRIIRVEWEVRGAVEIAHSLDPTVAVPIVVLSPVDSYAEWQLGENTVVPECTTRFRLHQGRVVQAGRPVAGSLTLRTKDQTKGRLRVELRRTELVQVSGGKRLTVVAAERELAHDAEFQAGVPQEFQFSLAVPDQAPPSVRTEQAAIVWSLHSVLDRGALRRNYESDYDIIVSTEAL